MFNEAAMLLLPQSTVLGPEILRLPQICLPMLQSFLLIIGKVLLKWEVTEWF